MTNFIFGKLPLTAAFEARVPPGIRSKADLLDVLYTVLQLPDYFGDNWDALEECIRDLSWLPEGNVVLFHEELPLVGDRPALATYISILHGAMEKWAAGKRRKLWVVFPSDAEESVQNAMQESAPD